LQSQGKAAEARTALMRTLALEPTLGDHEVIVYALNNLAFAHHAEREFPQAIALLRRAIARKSATPQVRSAMLHNLGSIYLELGQLRKARESFEQCLREAPPRPATLNYLARLAAKEDDYSRAQSLLEQALDTQRKALGETHPLVGLAWSDIAELQRDRKHYAASAETFQRALAILEGQELHTAGVLYHFGELRRMQGSDTEALALYERAIGILTRAYGPGHARLAIIYKRAAQGARRKDQAKEYMRLARTIEQSRPDYTRHTVDASAFVETK
jgi:tetratricopeptide (TPR) repeat protein